MYTPLRVVALSNEHGTMLYITPLVAAYAVEKKMKQAKFKYWLRIC
jgi:hypothetical protein